MDAKRSALHDGRSYNYITVVTCVYCCIYYHFVCQFVELCCAQRHSHFVSAGDRLSGEYPCAEGWSSLSRAVPILLIQYSSPQAEAPFYLPDLRNGGGNSEAYVALPGLCEVRGCGVLSLRPC